MGCGQVVSQWIYKLFSQYKKSDNNGLQRTGKTLRENIFPFLLFLEY